LLTHLGQSAGTLRLSYSLHAAGGQVERGMIRSVMSMLGVPAAMDCEITVIAEDPFINEAYSRGLAIALEGRIDEAEPMHLESLAIRREIGDRVGQSRILGMMSVLYENEGRFADAKAAASEAYEIASEANDRLIRYAGRDRSRYSSVHGRYLVAFVRAAPVTDLPVHV